MAKCLKKPTESIYALPYTSIRAMKLRVERGSMVAENPQEPKKSCLRDLSPTGCFPPVIAWDDMKHLGTPRTQLFENRFDSSS